MVDLIHHQDQDLALPPEQDEEQRPVLLYFATLSTDKSRQTAVDCLKRVAKAGKYASWKAIPWRSMNTEHTTLIRARLLNRPPRGLGYDPFAVKLTLSMLRGVLRQARKLQFFSAQALADMIDWPRISAARLPRGRALTADEIDDLRSFCARQGPIRGPFLKALLALLLGAGARREEVAVLPLDALEGSRLRILGKGQKERLIPLPTWAVTDLREWVQMRRKFKVQATSMLVRVDPKQRVYDRQISPWSVWNQIVNLTEDADIRGISTHDFRRTYASRLFETSDIRTIADLMGHKQITTTAGYDRRSEKAAEKAVEALEDWGRT